MMLRNWNSKPLLLLILSFSLATPTNFCFALAENSNSESSALRKETPEMAPAKPYSQGYSPQADNEPQGYRNQPRYQGGGFEPAGQFEGPPKAPPYGQSQVEQQPGSFAGGESPQPPGNFNYNQNNYFSQPLMRNYGGHEPEYFSGGNQYQQPSNTYTGQAYHVPPSRYYGETSYQNNYPQFRARPEQVYAPSGLTMPVQLQTAISTQVAREGDLIQGQISHMISLGGRGYIPAGTQIVGDVSKSIKGRRLSRSGLLSIEFTSMRLPDGKQIPIQAHLVGDIAKYKNKGQGQQDVFRGEGWGTKAGQLFLRGLGGAGLGAALGTGLGAIAGGGSGVGRGAWGGAAIGGGLGAADMLLRKGKDVIIPSGTEVEVQLDQPAALPSFAQGENNSGGGYYQGAY